MKFKDKKAYVYKVMRSCTTLFQVDVVVKWGTKILVGQSYIDDLQEELDLMRYSTAMKKYLIRRGIDCEAS